MALTNCYKAGILQEQGRGPEGEDAKQVSDFAHQLAEAVEASVREIK
ncbi:MAG: hypothetical protein JSS53_06320 [Proteobacteria bacterium]|nr:hypothetical protein [Pseudomonadota bacterium]